MGNKGPFCSKLPQAKKKGQRNPPKISLFKSLLEWPPNSLALRTPTRSPGAKPPHREDNSGVPDYSHSSLCLS